MSVTPESYDHSAARRAVLPAGALAEVILFPVPESTTYTMTPGEVAVPGTKKPVEYRSSIPSTLKSPYLHVLVPGLGGIQAAYDDARNVLAAEQGIATLTYEPPRHGGRRRDLINPVRVHADSLDALLEDFFADEALEAIPGAHEISRDQVVLVPHSWGGAAAAGYAKTHHQDVALITFKGSVGIEDPKLLRHLGRLPRSAVRELVPAIVSGAFGNAGQTLAMGSKMVGWAGGNPIRTLSEAVSCTVTDLRPDIMHLSNQGVKTALLYAEHDQLAPPHEAIKRCGGVVDYSEVIPEMDHLGLQRQPVRAAQHIANITHRLLTTS